VPGAGFHDAEPLSRRTADHGDPKPVPCVENRRWTFRGVTYATFDVQGSCNNLCPPDQYPDATEEAARDAANIQWLDQTFAEAKAQGSAGVMLGRPWFRRLGRHPGSS
jgi:hypothetical protein